MSLRTGLFLLFFLIQSVTGTAPLFALTEPVDHSLWDQFLRKFVNEKGEVDYRGVQKDPQMLEQYLEHLADRPRWSKSGPPWPREEELAFWINAYHAAVIDLVRRHYPIQTINDIPGVWNRGVFRIRSGDAFEGYSLNTIRSQMLMDAFHDEKVHAALSYGTRGCPRLRQEAYTGPRVEGQLFLAAQEFVNSEQFNRIVPGDKKIWISPLFKWNAKDFLLDFGVVEEKERFSTEEYAVLSFLHHYLENAEKISYLEEGEYKIKYLPFDWSLNEWIREEEPPAGSAPPPSS